MLKWIRWRLDLTKRHGLRKQLGWYVFAVFPDSYPAPIRRFSRKAVAIGWARDNSSPDYPLTVNRYSWGLKSIHGSDW